jgi:hypothetical protein
VSKPFSETISSQGELKKKASEKVMQVDLRIDAGL